jgi:hypothetical protein
VIDSGEFQRSAAPQTANSFDRVVPGVITIPIRWEPLQPGPIGARLRVVDFDGGRRQF